MKFLTALKISRGANSANQSLQYRRIDDLFSATRKQAPWKTIQVETDSRKKRRKFRVRKLRGYIKGITCEVGFARKSLERQESAFLLVLEQKLMRVF